MDAKNVHIIISSSHENIISQGHITITFLQRIHSLVLYFTYWSIIFFKVQFY